MISMRVIGTPLYQWEVGRQLQIIPLSGMKVNIVHFANYGDAEALTVETEEVNGMLIANIPNILLQNGRNLVAYSVNVSPDSCETIRECVFAIRSRPKPSDYVYTETEVLSYVSIPKRMEALEDGLEEQVSSSIEEYLKENPPTGGEVDFDQIKDYIDDQLQAAKESGEFDGEDGEDGKDGVDGGSIVNESFGSVVALNDSTDRNLHGLNIYGKTTQDGTPTPESPVELVTSGANGAINVSIGLSVDDTEPQTITVSTPNGLFGVPAANISAYPGNYTDENGQQWICDEIDFVRGVYIQRTKIVDMGSLNWRYSTGTYPYFYTEVSKKARSQAGALCTAYWFEPDYTKWKEGDLVFNDRSIKSYEMVNFVNRAYTDAAAFKEAMMGQTILVALETPVETPLSAEELAAYAELHTNYPTTTVYNDAGAGLGVKYVADTKLYIDNKFTELRNAILSAGANV